MEELLQGIGVTMFAILAVIGLLAGFIAGSVAGRNRMGYALLGLAGAVALPIVLAALGVVGLAAGGVLALVLAALLGSAIVLLIGKMIFD
ncbi:GlsB/YeaQ/YmgE family stress response membrane protein [Pseudooceanicola sp. C21-150M6]|uniref:GlsB/YeaQ/YmgE family stress response membrane protein n=1 Tax=Pseudooceanicola sp. C21-150M6 TaxID=3434355 RepID=UPI003D7FC90F